MIDVCHCESRLQSGEAICDIDWKAKRDCFARRLARNDALSCEVFPKAF